MLVGYIDGTPLSAAEKLAGAIELLFFARRSNEELWAAMNKVPVKRQYELETKMTEMIRAAIADSIAVEREACAKVAEATAYQYGEDAGCSVVAAAIRKRNE